MPSSRKPAQAKRVVELDHPLVRDHLTRLRDVQTPPDEFRRLVARLTWLLAIEATRDLRLRRRPVDTPLARYDGHEIAGRVGLVPILRAGLGMVDPVLTLIPNAEVWHLGVYRDESTHQPVEYYNKLPASRPVDVALILDPLLATGGSILAALAMLRDWHVPTVKVLLIISAREGVRTVSSQFPETSIYTCGIRLEVERSQIHRARFGRRRRPAIQHAASWRSMRHFLVHWDSGWCLR